MDERAQYADGSRLGARIALHRRFGTRTESWFDWVFARVERTAPRWVLDVGCGTAALWAGRVPAAWDVVLADLSPGMAREASTAAPGAACLVADLQALPFGSGCFDTVLANHMLYHVPDRALALEEIHRVLRPGGTLLASTNARASADALWDLAPERPDHAERFGLETGAPQLEAQFGRVHVERCENLLRITEADAVVRYLETVPGVTPEHLEAARRRVQAGIDAYGAFEVRTIAGILTARR